MINNKIKNLISLTWDLYIKNVLHITSICLFVMIIAMICNVISSSALNPLSLQSLIFNLSSRLFNIGLSLGLINVFLLLVKKNKTENSFTILFSSFDLIFRYFNGSVLFALAIMIALLPGLAILLLSSDFSNIFITLLNSLQLQPNSLNFDFNNLNLSSLSINNHLLFLFGLLVMFINFCWVTLRLQFYQYIIVDKECGAIQALKNSYDMTDGHISLLVQFFALLFIINLCGLLFFGVGLLITMPFSMLCMTKLYLAMKHL